MNRRAYKLKSGALLSLQFWKDKNGGLHFQCTTEDGDLCDRSVVKLDYYRFGEHFSCNSGLNAVEKEDFSDFCIGFLENYKK